MEQDKYRAAMNQLLHNIREYAALRDNPEAPHDEAFAAALRCRNNFLNLLVAMIEDTQAATPQTRRISQSN